MSTTVGAHTGAGPLSLMSCVRESSPLQDYETDVEKNAVSKRKFWNPKKWFRKKQKTSDDNVTQVQHQEHKDVDGGRSRSTGELSTDEEPSRSHDVRNSSSMHPGLSVSHDSVFHPLNSGSSDLELDGAQSSSSLSISQPLGDIKLQTELNSRLQLRRGRGDTSEDDEGLPRSPLCGSPAAGTDAYLLLEKAVNKDLPTKSHSTCSDGSLLSMDGSEMEEDSIGLPSKNSSKVSLNDKRTDTESDIELGPSLLTAPLNHSAAHHRVSVRPKRTYGAPRRKKISTALPATPEVNEESSTRSISPESVTTEPITELYSSATSRTSALTAHIYETKLKCNSLPAGATPPTRDSFRLSRSKSNAGKSQDDAVLNGEEREEKLSLFERLFPRRSAKKKKKEEKGGAKSGDVNVEVDGRSSFRRVVEEKPANLFSTPVTVKVHTTESKTASSHVHVRREEMRPIIAPRTGAASRQRVQPIDIPSSPISTRQSLNSIPTSPVSPERFQSGTSPIQAELENVLKHRQMQHSGLKEPPVPRSESPSPPKLWETSSSVTSKREYKLYESRSSHVDVKRESKTGTEDIRSKVKIAGLSALQQRVLSLNSEEEASHCSLTDIPQKPKKLITKSHSFKNQKIVTENRIVETNEKFNEAKTVVTKSSSLDSVKNLDEPILKSELKMTLKPVKTFIEDRVKVKPVVTVVEDDVKVKSDNTDDVNHIKPTIKETLISPKHEETILANQTTSDVCRETSEIENKSNIQNISADGDKSEYTSKDNSYTSNTHSSSIFEEHSVKTNEQPTVLPTLFNDAITISGPSHTAVVNVTSQSEETFKKSSVKTESENSEKEETKIVSHRESQVSVTKIHLKQETTEVTKTNVTVLKPNVPEFLNKQLNKVESRPSSNIILSMKTPKSPEDTETAKAKSSVSVDSERPQHLPRKFSKEDVEIIEKTPESVAEKDVSPPKTPTLVSVAPLTPNQNRFRKNDSRPSSRKSSVISITPESPVKEHIKDRALKTRSISLDSLKTDQNGTDTATIPDKSSQDSLDRLEKKTNETVVLRRKSIVKQSNEEEPELMKVFARRSLKLKDNEIEQLQEAIQDEKLRDSDKENIKEITPELEQQKPSSKEKKNGSDDPTTNSKPKISKTPLHETKKLTESVKNSTTEESDVQLRRNINNNIFLSSQRTVSLSLPKTIVPDFHIKKQPSLSERRKTDQWQTIKDENVVEEKKTDSEIILNISEKSEEIQSATKNFSQRKAEWEKRAQQAHK
ncbi:uncharacterized protein LOC115890830 isoform X2 [Sitophilus oryzae]|uniref:Uncharacterized protein LOC115890830 isoform X2 n=1 Tax=Sitophilus oryzae TaxID=7048 RepID=A0A6J2YW04_SITOR|nr:uncharacterized protein LOC115890830 isoform X2 [Sitophilus oryzae]